MGDPNGPGPIYSTRADDPELSDAIHAFVVGLAERIDALQDSEVAGSVDEVAGMGRDLGSQSDRLGFELMAASAARLIDSCDAHDPDALHKAVVDVTEIAQRVRQGHRGAS
jgi:hypothetical protein